MKKTAKERQEASNLYWKKVDNNKIKKKVDQLNGILNGKNVTGILYTDTSYMVTFTNRQVFRFTFYPEHLFTGNKIIVKLED